MLRVALLIPYGYFGYFVSIVLFCIHAAQVVIKQNQEAGIETTGQGKY